jgi:nicotinamidase-related amidase
MLGGFTATRRLGGREGVDKRWAFTIVEPLTPREGETMVYKQRASAFFGTPLQAHLRLLDIDTVLILGESTSGCVRSSVIDAYSAGFEVAVIEECTFDRSDLVHKVNLFDMHHKYAEVVHVDDVKQYIRGVARTPATAAV